MQFTSTSSHTVLLLALKVPASCTLHICIPHELYNLICCYSYSHLDLETDPSTAVNGETLSSSAIQNPKVLSVWRLW